MAVDCCEHVLKRLNRLPGTDLLKITPKDVNHLKRRAEVDLIAIGISQYPVRRLFISQLRVIYPDVPILVLRREQISPANSSEQIRCEFVLSDKSTNDSDCDLVTAIRKILPFEPCKHLKKNDHYEIVGIVVEALSRGYNDPSLNMKKIAQTVNTSPKRLSTILNQHVGVSFRNMLRRVRIEQAKRMLSTNQYSVKEVAAQVGFTDSHYFSRSFKELTGQNASEYQEKASAL
jgi:AraC-like DNA-binding protein